MHQVLPALSISAWAYMCSRHVLELKWPQVDVCFDRAEQLQPLPRLAFVLQNCPLLHGPQPAAAAAAADRQADAGLAAAKLRVLMQGLGPSDLAAALYPALSSWTSPDAQACPASPRQAVA